MRSRRRRPGWDPCDRAGLYYAEGVRFLVEAVDHGAAIEALVVSKALLRSALGQKLVRRLRRAGTPCRMVTPERFRELSTTPRASGVGLVLREEWTPLRKLDLSRGTCWLALRHVKSPGNLGTLLRTLAAVGGGGVIFLGPEATPFHPAAVRATMGALFELRFARTTTGEFARWRRQRPCRVIGAAPQARLPYTEAEFGPHPIIVLGEEGLGMDTDEHALCDQVVRIPMAGSIDSLNLGVAGSLMLYESVRARSTAGFTTPHDAGGGSAQTNEPWGRQ